MMAPAGSWRTSNGRTRANKATTTSREVADFDLSDYFGFDDSIISPLDVDSLHNRYRRPTTSSTKTATSQQQCCPIYAEIGDDKPPSSATGNNNNTHHTSNNANTWKFPTTTLTTPTTTTAKATNFVVYDESVYNTPTFSSPSYGLNEHVECRNPPNDGGSHNGGGFSSVIFPFPTPTSLHRGISFGSQYFFAPPAKAMVKTRLLNGGGAESSKVPKDSPQTAKDEDYPLPPILTVLPSSTLFQRPSLPLSPQNPSCPPLHNGFHNGDNGFNGVTSSYASAAASSNSPLYDNHEELLKAPSSESAPSSTRVYKTVVFMNGFERRTSPFSSSTTSASVLHSSSCDDEPNSLSSPTSSRREDYLAGGKNNDILLQQTTFNNKYSNNYNVNLGFWTSEGLGLANPSNFKKFNQFFFLLKLKLELLISIIKSK